MGKEKLNGHTSEAAANVDLEGNTAPALEDDTGSRNTPTRSGVPYSNFRRFFASAFEDPEIETLYQKYFSRSKRDGTVIAVVLSAVLNVAAIVSSGLFFSLERLVHLVVMATFLVANVILVGLLRSSVLPDRTRDVIPVIVWFMTHTQLYCDVILGPAPIAPSLGVGWQTCIIYSMFTILPFRLRGCILFSFFSCCLHAIVIIPLIISSYNYNNVFLLPNTIGANVIFFLGAVVLGVVVFCVTDRAYRQAFMGINASLAVSRQVEESSKEQESLLLSVLPKHVATEMIKDLGGELAGQFRKVYMNRHEDVSILFADIVGFTAMSSKVTPGELVKILNDLFATFDKLAMKYHQLRIKILGDCYYCVCGCPDPRPDHAVLAVHMGLSVVDAISDVREKTQSGVNMRVGVHTGAILGGVLGQNRWQYDVVGKEVTLANQMESGGIAGRVHISSVTASFLSEEFELEPGEGELREDGIRAAGLKTYLIKSVLKPYPQGTLAESQPSKEERTVTPEEEVKPKEERSTVHDLEMILIEREKTASRLGNRVNLLTQRFRDAKMEADFLSTRRSYAGAAILMTSFVLIASFIAQLCLLPKTLISIVAFMVGACILISLSVISISTSFPKLFPRPVVRLASWIERTQWFMATYVTFTILILSAQGIAGILTCERSLITNTTSLPTFLDTESPTCDYVTYYSNIAVFIQLCTVLQVQVSYLLQIGLNLLLAVVYFAINVILRPDLYSYRDAILINSLSNSTMWSVPTSHMTTSISLISVALALCFYGRYLERVARRLFFYQHEMDEMKNQIDVIRRKNEALIYNILPAHVAKLFIGAKRTDEDLYSQHYEEAGVMFASCPNFNHHYTEDAVNNNGLEWIRFLNEVLSDYDDLLNEPRFKTVVKIKTVASTYMAASGINLEKPIPKNASVRVRWQHLAALVDFGFALRETLDRINAQSFNTFMLRIGIKHGPLLAGVIGAGKPHYDIWGNTVNVASRMDSTGQLGKIQITEDTMLILREFNYKFEKRGIVKVKGKGELLTYFLVGKEEELDEVILPNQVTPS